MKKTTILAGLCIMAFAAHNLNATVLCAEAEDFQFQGDWMNTSQGNAKVLFTDKSNIAPGTVINIPEAGEYSVWASAFDMADFRPGTRLIEIGIDGAYFDTPAGKHGKEGFAWEKLGSVKLAAGEVFLSARVKTDHVRFDAVALSNNPAFNPNEDLKYIAKRNAATVKPVIKEVSYDSSFKPLPKFAPVKNGKKISISKGGNGMAFTEVQGEDGSKFFVRSALVTRGGKLTELAPFADEALYVISSKDPGYDGSSYYTNWKDPRGKPTIQVAGKTLAIDMPPNNPYCIGNSELLRVLDVEKVSADTLKLKYKDGAFAVLKLLDNGLAKFDVQKEAQEASYYSFAFLGFDKLDLPDFSNAFLPTLYQGRRTMKEPRMVENRMTSQPLAMVENSKNGFVVTNMLAANPDNLPFEWSFKNTSYYGFSISAPDSKVQTAIFSPVLGAQNSQKKEGDKIEASFYLASVNGDWCSAFELADKKIFKTDVIRETFTCSFSDSIANIAAYLKNEEASGWSRDNKGRWNIEAQNTSSQASPLSEVSVALLTDDEDYYRNIALPTIEYTLSRRTSHFAYKNFATGSWTQETMKDLNVPSGGTPGDVFAGINRVLGGGNTWLKEFYFNKDGSPKTCGNPEWTTLLGIYLAEPTPELLEKTKQACDRWIEKAFYARDYGDPSVEPFINYGLYPYWWYLPAMYEATGDKKYLDFAVQGAFYSLSSLWSYPTPPDGEVTINKDNVKQGIREEFWRGGERFRLGNNINEPAVKMLSKYIKFKEPSQTYIIAEKKVPAMQVSRIGLGIEQHWTYKWTGNYHNILMPSWAAEMLKVYQFSGRDILMKFSRHSIIGRYANFPGYYIKDFTDVQHDADYPYKGPDSTSFYYHHAPCHFGQSMDYFVTQLEIASKGKIKFPYVRQQGYVWFTDRIFGLPGKVFEDESCRPILDKNAVRPDSIKVSTLLARGKDFIWVLALNDSASERSVNFDFDATARGLKGAKTFEKISLYDADGKKLDAEFEFFGKKEIKMPPFGLIAMRIPAELYNSDYTAKPIIGEAHIVQKNIGKGWGDLHSFRIRGPFGKDSVFVILTGGRTAKGKVVLKLSSPTAQISEKTYFPFEFSIYPLPQDADISLGVEILEDGKEPILIKDINLKK